MTKYPFAGVLANSLPLGNLASTSSVTPYPLLNPSNSLSVNKELNPHESSSLPILSDLTSSSSPLVFSLTIFPPSRSNDRSADD